MERLGPMPRFIVFAVRLGFVRVPALLAICVESLEHASPSHTGRTGATSRSASAKHGRIIRDGGVGRRLCDRPAPSCVADDASAARQSRQSPCAQPKRSVTPMNAVTVAVDRRRCAWALGDPLLTEYHDNEWGRRVAMTHACSRC